MVTQALTLREREVSRLVRLRLLLALHELIEGLGDNRLPQSFLVLLGQPNPHMMQHVLYSCRMAAWFEITFPITRTVAMVFANRLSLPMSSSSRSTVRAAQAVTQIDLAAVLFLWKPARLLAVAGRVGDDQVDHLCASHLVQCISARRLMQDSVGLVWSRPPPFLNAALAKAASKGDPCARICKLQGRLRY